MSKKHEREERQPRMFWLPPPSNDHLGRGLANPSATSLLDSEKKFRYVDPVVYNKRRFPAYCNGPTYILSKSTVRDLLRAAANVRFMTVEDILFTGIC
jgi:hypothetical protein